MGCIEMEFDEVENNYWFEINRNMGCIEIATY